MLFLAWVWARVGVVGDGLVSIETHNNSGDCSRSARVLVRLCLLDLEGLLLPVLTRFGSARLGGCCICVLGGEVWRRELVRQGVLVVVCSALLLLARQGGELARRV